MVTRLDKGWAKKPCFCLFGADPLGLAETTPPYPHLGKMTSCGATIKAAVPTTGTLIGIHAPLTLEDRIPESGVARPSVHQRQVVNIQEHALEGQKFTINVREDGIRAVTALLKCT